MHDLIGKGCLAFLLLVAACNEAAGPRVEPPAEGELRINPRQVDRAAAPGTEFDIDYRLERYQGGSWSDVTAGATWGYSGSIDAVMEGPVLRVIGASAGEGFVEASLADGSGTARGEVRVRWVSREAASAVPTTASAALDANNATTGLLAAYPEDGVLLPENLVGLELHWHSTFERYFRVSVTSPFIDFQRDVRCEHAGCQWAFPEALLRAIAYTHGGDEEGVRWSVRAVREDGTGPLASEPRRIAFTKQPVRGAIYYWRAEPGAVMRAAFGQSEPPELFAGSSGNSIACVGCHTVSRNGDRIALGTGIPFPAGIKVVDSRTALETGTTTGNFMSFSPDARSLVRTQGDGLTIDTWDDLGARTSTVLVAQGTMPAWSPDGTRIVFVEAAPPPGPVLPGFTMEQVHFMGGALWQVVAQDGGWSAPMSLVPGSSANDFYPDFSPEGDWVLFERSEQNNDSFEAPDGDLWMVAADGMTVVELARANTATSCMNSWPKFAPFVQTHNGRRLTWVTFSSRRGYGSRRPAAGAPPAQIWMAAVDLDRAAEGIDPSYPAFWLPHQEPGSGNHLAQWARALLK